MSTEMDRRSFVGLAAAMIAATYIPKEVVETIDRITKAPVIRNPHVFVVRSAEWIRDWYRPDFLDVFRIHGYFPARPELKEIYCAAKVDLDFIKTDRGTLIKNLLLEMERNIGSYCKDSKAVIVYDGKLKEAIESKGVHLEY